MKFKAGKVNLFVVIGLILTIVVGAVIGGYFIVKKIIDDKKGDSGLITGGSDGEQNPNGGNSGNNEGNGETQEPEKTLTKLETVNTFSIKNGTVLTWAANNSAKQYKVTVGDEIKTVDSNEIDLSSLDTKGKDVLVVAVPKDSTVNTESETANCAVYKIMFNDREFLRNEIESKYLNHKYINGASDDYLKAIYSDYAVCNESIYAVEGQKIGSFPEKFRKEFQMPDVQNRLSVDMNVYEYDTRLWFANKQSQEFADEEVGSPIFEDTTFSKELASKSEDKVFNLYVKCYRFGNLHKFETLSEADKTVKIEKRAFALIKTMEIPPYTQSGEKLIEIGSISTYLPYGVGVPYTGAFQLTSGKDAYGKHRYGFADDNIERLRVPNTVEIIRKKAFLNQHNLRILIIPESVKRIETEAFALDNSYLPSSYNSCYVYGLCELEIKGSPIIESRAFNKCRYMTNITLQTLENVFEKQKDVFDEWGIELFGAFSSTRAIALGGYINTTYENFLNIAGEKIELRNGKVIYNGVSYEDDNLGASKCPYHEQIINIFTR